MIDKFSQALTLMRDAFADAQTGAGLVASGDLAAEVDGAQEVINAASAVQVLRVAQYAGRDQGYDACGAWGEVEDLGVGHVSDFASDCFGPMLAMGSIAAERKVQTFAMIATKLPMTLAAMSTGDLDSWRATIIATELFNASAQSCAAVEALIYPAVLGEAPGRVTKRVRRVLGKVDADALRVKAAKERLERFVHAYPSHVPGLTCWAASLPAAESAACWAAIDDLAHQMRGDDPGRTLEQCRADAFVDLILTNVTVATTITLMIPVQTATTDEPDGSLERDLITRASNHTPTEPHPTGPPGTTTTGTTTGSAGDTAAGSTSNSTDDAPCSTTTAGSPDTTTEGAASQTAAGSPDTTTEGAASQTAAGSPDTTTEGAASQTAAGSPDTTTEGAASQTAAGSPDTTTEGAAGGTAAGSDGATGEGLSCLDRFADFDDFGQPTPDPNPFIEPSWQQIATMGYEIPGIGVIGGDIVAAILDRFDTRIARVLLDERTGVVIETGLATYLPNAAMRRFIHKRDTTCRFPSCARTAKRCEPDHVIPYSRGGPTTPWNLASLCKHHHRVKHQAGWKLVMTREGVCTWTDPHGRQYATHPTDHHQLAA